MAEATEMENAPQIGERITDKATIPDDDMIHTWIGPEAFAYWLELQNWVEEFYPGVFAPDWLYGGQNKGWSLRYKKIKAFCTFIPGYRRLSATVVLGGVEREMFADRRSTWRPELVKLYGEAKTYPDGKFLTLAISSAEDSQELKALLTMKRPPISRG